MGLTNFAMTFSFFFWVEYVVRLWQVVLVFGDFSGRDWKNLKVWSLRNWWRVCLLLLPWIRYWKVMPELIDLFFVCLLVKWSALLRTKPSVIHCSIWCKRNKVDQAVE